MIDYTNAPGESLPGGGPTGLSGDVITVPFVATTVGGRLVGRDCYLMGWSIRETTGTAGAVCELYDGNDATGSFVAAVDTTSSGDPIATQSPQSATGSGGAAAQAPTFGGAAGTLAFLTNLEIYGLGATGATEVTATLTGVQGGTISIPISVPAGATTPITPVQLSFGARGLQASAVAQAITLNLPSFGAGNTLEVASIQGYLLTSASFSNTRNLWSDGIRMQMGVFLNVISGSVKGAVWIKS